MNNPFEPTDDPGSQSELERIIAVCDRFESAWKTNQPRRIEDLLLEADDIPRPKLLQELVALEVELRRSRGDQPTAEEYAARFPDRADFLATLKLEDLKRSRPNSSGETSRNLLFGILALQNNFISRDDLLAAFNLWVTDKSRKLGQILVDRATLDVARRSLLEALVVEHLKQHGGDPEASLAALSSLGSAHDDLNQIPDPDLRASLSLANSARDATHDATLSYAPLSRRAGDRFRVLRFHKKGGLGQIHVARDEELNREVALKEILPDKSSIGDFRSRFVLEAEINGGLEHPGIVPVYSLGTYDDGRPFYAMRFIEGDSLKEAIESYHKTNPQPDPTTVAFRKLLGRFVDVCEAISYAHSKGVLHRDLKPHNIMLGRYGETLLIDWGLAKATGKREPSKPDAPHEATLVPSSGSGHSPTVGVMGSPPYMSPEQADGKTDTLGTTTDVYGLGATLYALLTGKAPVQGKDTVEILERARRGEIAPPRSLNPRIPRSLEAICTKALALKPGERYQHARELADDVERWLADEPVSARRDPISTRISRWVRKHQVATATAMATLVVGLAATLYSYQRERTYTKKLEVANEEAIAAVKKFGDVVANDPTLKNSPALADLRKRLLNEPLSFLRALRTRLQADGDTRPESLARLAEVSFALGKLSDQIGDKQDAMIAHRESLAIRRRLANAYPTDIVLQSALATSYNNVGVLLGDTGKPAEAMSAYESALAIHQRLVEAHPDDNDIQAYLATSHTNIGILLSSVGKPAEAMTAFRSALQIHQRLADAHPTVTEFQSDLATSYNNVGVLLKDAGKLSEAMKAYESALAVRQKLAIAHPRVTNFQSDLAASHNNIGVVLRNTGKLAEAIKALESALTIRRSLVGAHPTFTEFQRALAASHSNVGIALMAAKKPVEAMKALEAGLAIWQKLADAHPTDTEFQSGLAYNQNNIGALLVDFGKPVEAIKALEPALAILQGLADAHPTVTEYQRRLAASHFNIGNLLRQTGKAAEALKAYESAIAIQQKLASDHPETPEFASELSKSLNNIGSIDLGARRFGAACARLRQAIEWQRKALATNPANPTYRGYLDTDLYLLIKAAEGLGDTEGVAKAKRELAELRDSSPAMVALGARLAAVLKGKTPRDDFERIRLVLRAHEKAMYAVSARLFAEALANNPKLGEDRQTQHRYNAACAAVLAGSGQGNDVPKPDDAMRVRLRAQALDWLKAELSAWERVSTTVGPGNKELVAKTLEHWKTDADLAGVRDEKALATLPEGERADWKQLWADVEALLERTRGKVEPPKGDVPK